MGEGENRPSLQYEALSANSSIAMPKYRIVWSGSGLNLRKRDEMSSLLRADEIFHIDHHRIIGENVGLWARAFHIAAQCIAEPLGRPEASLRKPQEDCDGWHEEAKNLQCG
jgi:hypothetical protein